VGNSKHTALASLSVLAAAILWGTTGTVQKFLPAGTAPGVVGAVRLGTGGIILLLLAIKQRAFAGTTSVLSRLTFIAAACIAVFQPLYFTGIARTGVAVGTVVAIGSSPIFAGLLGWLLDKEKPEGRWFGATALAIAGCSLLSLGGGRISVNLIGIACSLTAGLAFAAYTAASKSLLPGRPAGAVLAVIFCLSGILLSPFLSGQDLTWLATGRGAALVIYLGLVTVALPYSLYSAALNLLPAATAVTLSLAEPLTGALLGILVIKERLDPPSLLGICLLLCGLLVMLRAPTKTGRQTLSDVSAGR